MRFSQYKKTFKILEKLRLKDKKSYSVNFKIGHSNLPKYTIQSTFWTWTLKNHEWNLCENSHSQLGLNDLFYFIVENVLNSESSLENHFQSDEPKKEAISKRPSINDVPLIVIFSSPLAWETSCLRPLTYPPHTNLTYVIFLVFSSRCILAYCDVASYNMSRSEAHTGFFRLLIKGIYWTFCTVTFQLKVGSLISNAC